MSNIAPQFTLKAGDWVRDKRIGMKRTIVQLKENCIALTNPREYGTQYELWQPEEGEWCCFHNGTEQFTVAKFQNHTDNTDTHFKLVSCYGKWTEIFKYCEPFIGELPSFLKAAHD